MIKKMIVPFCLLFLSFGLLYGLVEWLNINILWAISPFIISWAFFSVRYFSEPTQETSSENNLKKLAFPKLLGLIYLIFICAFAIRSIMGEDTSLNSLSLMMILMPIYALVCSVIAKHLNANTSNKISEKTAE